jgi:tetratricopeptide (TPR) repeat protein
VARVSVAALRGGKPTAAQIERVEGWLVEARGKDPKSSLLLLLQAELQDRRGRHAEAVALYRGVLEREPRNVLALNNLAFQLALRRDDPATASRALALIQEAVDEAGPQADLLDTRAVIYLTQGKADLAIKDLRQALTEAPSATLYFHLAQAHLLLNRDRQAARAAYRKACDLGLREDDAHPLERPHVRQLIAQMK